MDQTIEKVSFCAPDRNYDKAFSYICRDGTTRRWMCHCFMALKDSVSSSCLSLVVLPGWGGAPQLPPFDLEMNVELRNAGPSRCIRVSAPWKPHRLRGWVGLLMWTGLDSGRVVPPSLPVGAPRTSPPHLKRLPCSRHERHQSDGVKEERVVSLSCRAASRPSRPA